MYMVVRTFSILSHFGMTSTFHLFLFPNIYIQIQNCLLFFIILKVSVYFMVLQMFENFKQLLKDFELPDLNLLGKEEGKETASKQNLATYLCL